MTDDETTDTTAFDPNDFDVTIERTFDAPREVVWDAWTDPEQVAEWWGPTGFTVPRCELDVRPGGALRIDMKGPDGTVYPSEGVFEEVVEPERLVLVDAGGEFSVSFVGDEDRTEIGGTYVKVVGDERIVHTWEPGRVTIELRDGVEVSH